MAPTLTMYDSVNVAALPARPGNFAAYVDGKNTADNYSDVVARFFPTARIVPITVVGNPGAAVADVEKGDLTPASGAAWARDQITLGRRPTLYYAKDSATAVAQALAAAGVPNIAVDYFVADWTGSPHMVPGSVATQWANPATSGGDFDVSLADAAWFARVAIGPPPAPLPPAPPITSMPVGDKMLSIVQIPTDTAGNGWRPTTIPWASFQAATINGSDPDPAADGVYWPGNCKVQNRNGNVLVSVVGCLPKTTQVVYVLSADPS